MNLHEYQSKELLSEYGLPVLNGILCYTPKEAEAAYDMLGSSVCVVKAQVHAGGRGKAGGVKVVKSAEEAREAAEKILGMKLITPQTGKQGKIVRKVYVEQGCEIDKEYYLSLLVDRSKKCVSIVASAEGGTEIEELAKKAPEKILTLSVPPETELESFHCLKLGRALGLTVEQAREFKETLFGLYAAFVEKDLSLLEINPLVLNKDGNFVLLDAKCAVDDNALFRQQALLPYRDYDEMDDRDLKATKHGLSFVGLDGNIGCLVNGAGLAMATMDIIKQCGGEPANFLDVGGGASKEAVTEAFKILLSDSRVKAILVNIFGGIMKCDVIAEGIVAAAKEVSLNVPLVVRLQGTNVDLGRDILKKSGLNIISASTMDEAAKKAVSAAG
ncbi:MAG: ADP-forming succinate--CoA ligase subunit beta [Candidatus Dadabacteria bacterium]|nr:MAG: ADP-forming succinate--CoA ligase subunit beta [Candidatus Dadabacteria bacterium]